MGSGPSLSTRCPASTRRRRRLKAYLSKPGLPVPGYSSSRFLDRQRYLLRISTEVDKGDPRRGRLSCSTYWRLASRRFGPRSPRFVSKERVRSDRRPLAQGGGRANRLYLAAATNSSRRRYRRCQQCASTPRDRAAYRSVLEARPPAGLSRRSLRSATIRFHHLRRRRAWACLLADARPAFVRHLQACRGAPSQEGGG